MSTKFNTTVTNSSVSYKITTAGWYRIYIQHTNSNNVGDMKILINGRAAKKMKMEIHWNWVRNIFIFLEQI